MAERLPRGTLCHKQISGLGWAKGVSTSVCVSEHNAFSILSLWQHETGYVSARLVQRCHDISSKLLCCSLGPLSRCLTLVLSLHWYLRQDCWYQHIFNGLYS